MIAKQQSEHSVPARDGETRDPLAAFSGDPVLKHALEQDMAASERDGDTLSDERLATLRMIAYRDGDLPWEDARLLFNTVAALRAQLADANGRLDEAGLSKQEILDAVIELERRDHIMFVRSASRDIRRALDRIDSRIDSEISLRAARAASGKDTTHA